MFLLDSLVTPLPSFVKVVERCVIFNFAIARKVHFSLKIQGKINLKTPLAKFKRPGTPRRALPRRRAWPRRQASVRVVPASGAHAEAPERPLVTALRRRELTRVVRGKWAEPGGVDPLAGAPPMARHWPPERPRRRPCRDLSTCAWVTVVTSLVPNRPPAPTKTCPGGSSRARAPATEPRRPPLAPPVWTSLLPTSSPPQAPKPFLVHHKWFPSRLLIKPSRANAGARAPAAAARPPPTSSPLRQSSEPRHLPSVFPRPHGSSRSGTLLSIALSLTTARAPAAAPPLHRRRRSPATSPAEPPPSFDHGWAQSQFPIACLPAHAPPCRRRARYRHRVQGGRAKGLIVRVLKVLGS
jgi:hypothetical protein